MENVVMRSTDNYFMEAHEDGRTIQFGPRTPELMALHAGARSVFWKLPDELLAKRYLIANALREMKPEMFDAVCYNYLEFDRMVDFSGNLGIK